jgi:hypothetical protein
METHFNIQRRLYDYQFSLTPTPAELERQHQAFIQTYNTIAHQGLLNDQRLPPIPIEVLQTGPRPHLCGRGVQSTVPRTHQRHERPFYPEERRGPRRAIVAVFKHGHDILGHRRFW